MSNRQGRNNNSTSRGPVTGNQSRPYSGNNNNDGSTDEIELDTKILQVNNKRYYVDVKQNLRGKFIKISEIGPGNRKSRILLTFPVAAEMRDRLSKLKEFYDSLPDFPANTEENNGQREEVKLASETIVRESRRYYLDLKENHRGRFLRVTMLTQNQRAQILLPAPGAMNELRNTLEGNIREFASPNELLEAGAGGGSENGAPLSGPMESKSMRGPLRMFYFDVGSNRRGMFLRVSEVRSTYRTAITISDRQWSKFRDILSSYVDQLDEARKNLREAEEKSGRNNAGGGNQGSGDNSPQPPTEGAKPADTKAAAAPARATKTSPTKDADKTEATKVTTAAK